MEIYHPKDEELLREMRRVRRSAKTKRLVWGLVIWLALSVAAGIFVFNRYYRLAVMRGPAMGDTLPAGSLVLVRRAEEQDVYQAGEIVLYEKQQASLMEMTILSPKGKTREYCEYRLYRDMGTTRQYLLREGNQTTWALDIRNGELLTTDENGTLLLDTEGIPNGEYWLRETRASYGQDVLQDPIPITVANPVHTQLKRVLAAPGDRLVLSPYAETRVNGQEIDRSFRSGRTADAPPTEARRVVMPTGEYFVQGDQLSLSLDSRDRDFDTVRQSEVLGRADFVLWPIRAFGPLTAAPQTTVDEEGEAE